MPLRRLLDATEPVSSKVPPTIGVMFWVIKVLTTGAGEAGSDAMARANVLAAGCIGLGGFIYALRRQFRADRYIASTYWFAVAMVAVFGTMAADAVHLFWVPYPVTTALYALATGVILYRWHRSEGTLSIHSITTVRRERFYWATVFATFALGTAAGDLTASTLRLGFLDSGLLFAGAIALPFIAWRLGLNSVVAFWIAYVLTRPLGASFADWLGKPRHISKSLAKLLGAHAPTGLGLTDALVTCIAAVLIIGCVALTARAQRTTGSHAAAPVR